MTKKTKIIIAILMILALAVSFIGGKTYSKYLTEVTGNGGAQIAKWSFKVNGESAQMQTINLIQTCTEESLTNGKIAPGTSGYFDIIIDAKDSDVGLNYKVVFNNEQQKPENLLFFYEGVSYNSIKDLESKLCGTINANDFGKIKNYSIEWKWLYESEPSETSDQIDTQDGINLSNYSFDVVVTGTQLMPTQ